MIPLILDLSDKRVLLFGAGSVGVRKAGHFAGICRMTIVSREIPQEVLAFPKVSVKQTSLADTDAGALIGRHDIIIAALPDKADNEKICQIAREAGKWYNSANSPSNFFIPSVVAGDEYLIAVSTKGSSPGVPKFIREKLETDFAGLDNMIRLQKNLRENLKKTVPNQKKRAGILRSILQDETVWAACRDGGNTDRLVEKYR
jgi:precorrin-2 dehydrogenase/sirohydrochlorin ferrochelatase